MKKLIKLSAILLVCVMLLSSCYMDVGSVIDLIFAPDYKEITNDIFTKYIEMNVTVITTHQTSKESYSSQGSGVIYKEDRSYYYCLTNAHVVASDSSHEIITYTVYDCYGQQHIGALVNSDPEYDLAVIKFMKGKEPLCVVDLATRDPFIGEDVIILGTPNGLINSVTYGDVCDYGYVNMTEEDGERDDNVAFDVIWHDAPMWEGASGSVLLNTDMELVGINYAVSTDDEGNFVYGYAISVSKVLEYLNKHRLK
jgi:S1-C subfamily serine protease